MKPTWKKYLLYGSAIIAGGGLLFILIQTCRAKNTGFETKTLWDWMELLVIPLVLAIGAFYLNRSERDNERKIAADRQQEAALQSYLDRMSDLLLNEKLRTTKKREVRDVARTRTLTVLRGLDWRRKGIVVLFLYEAGLIADEPVVDLAGADLTKAELLKAKLPGANLRGVDLSEAFLWKANLERADLTAADLSHTHLEQANLSGTNLSRANLFATNLSESNLIGANVRDAELILVDLSDADLSEADLRGSLVWKEQLATTKALQGAMMPDGTKHD